MGHLSIFTVEHPEPSGRRHPERSSRLSPAEWESASLAPSMMSGPVRHVAIANSATKATTSNNS
jgi:hypothetical protein